MRATCGMLVDVRTKFEAKKTAAKAAVFIATNELRRVGV